MARLSKDEYDRRCESAARRMADNAEINTLTEEQHEWLADLCKFRHELHCNQEALFVSGSGEFSNYWRRIRNLCQEAKAVGFKLPDYEDEFLPDDSDFNEDELEYKGETYPANCDVDSDEYDYKRDAAFWTVTDFAGEVNTAIENMLRDVDKEHGTNYCPTGTHRVY